MEKSRALDMVILVCVIVIFITVIFLISYYLNNKNQQCLQNPFVFGAKNLEQRYGYEVIGTIQLLTPANIKPVNLFFDSTNITLQ